MVALPNEMRGSRGGAMVALRDLLLRQGQDCGKKGGSKANKGHRARQESNESLLEPNEK